VDRASYRLAWFPPPCTKIFTWGPVLRALRRRKGGDFAVAVGDGIQAIVLAEETGASAQGSFARRSTRELCNRPTRALGVLRSIGVVVLVVAGSSEGVGYARA
jgi:hypothetical protein